MITQEALSNALSSCHQYIPILDYNIGIARFHKSKVKTDVTPVLAEIFPDCIAEQITTRLCQQHLVGRVLPQLQRRLSVQEQRKQEREAFRRTRQGMMIWTYDIMRIMSGHGSLDPESRKINPIYMNYKPTWCELGRVIYPTVEDVDWDEE